MVYVAPALAGAAVVLALLIGRGCAAPPASVPPSASKPVALTLNDVVTGLQSQIDKVHDIEVHYEIITGALTEKPDGTREFAPGCFEYKADGNEGAFTPGTFGIINCIWKEKGEKVSLQRTTMSMITQPDEQQIASGADSVLTWDGKQGRMWSHYLAGGAVSGLIESQPNGNLRVAHQRPVQFTTRLWEEYDGTLENILRKYEGKATLRSDTVTVEGERCVLVEVRDRQAERLLEKYWLAADKGFNLVRYETYDYFGRLGYRICVTSLKEVSPGIWFPFGGLIESLGQKQATRYTATDVLVNQGLPDSDFTIAFAPGTHIADDINHRKYIEPAR
jgi:hypothetical protein